MALGNAARHTENPVNSAVVTAYLGAADYSAFKCKFPPEHAASCRAAVEDITGFHALAAAAKLAKDLPITGIGRSAQHVTDGTTVTPSGAGSAGHANSRA